MCLLSEGGAQGARVWYERLSVRQRWKSLDNALCSRHRDLTEDRDAGLGHGPCDLLCGSMATTHEWTEAMTVV